MIPELGLACLIVALIAAGVQTAVPLTGAARGDRTLMQIGSTAAYAGLLCVTAAFLCLTYGYVTSDFSIMNVAANSHTAKPLLYKVAGVWGNHEGSILLWILILLVFSTAVAASGQKLPATLRARVIGIQGAIAFGFLAFSVFTSNPFARLDPAPLEGRGLNPLLQDPGLAFHPPMLYMGYVGFSVAFSFAIAALLEGRVDPAWGRWVRPWTLAAWCTLTLGIAMGSWWAYYELGWGGWWFWDPVENASLMPWLAGTALLHSAIVVEKRDTLKRWTILLAILTFSLSLLGTFLVRSGVLNSVHSFASDPKRGLFILIFLSLVVGGSLLLYWRRAPALSPGGVFGPVSRETSLVVNNFLLAAASATVLFGTLYPLFLDAITGEKISVGAPYFNSVVIPLMVPLILVMAIGPQLSWKRSVLGALRSTTVICGVISLALAGGVGIYMGGPLTGVLGLALGLWLVTSSIASLVKRLGGVGPAFRLGRISTIPRAYWGMFTAHIGFAILVLGITGVSTWQQEAGAMMGPGQRIELAGYTLVLDGVERVKGPNYDAERGTFRVLNGDRQLGLLTPEVRQYTAPPMTTTEAAIMPRLLGDIYVAIGNPDDLGRWGVRLYFKPMVLWLWSGAIIMFLGGLLSLTDRRIRIGIPLRLRRPVSVAPEGVA